MARTWSWVVWGFLSLVVPRAALAQAGYDAGNERYERLTLPNGLRVQMAEDHRAPLVAIVIRYPVGSLHDPADRRGLAELIGKLLPRVGTRHLPGGAADLIEAAGFYPWEVTANVREEDTNVQLLVPAGAVDLALFIEAERMGFAADGLTSGALEQAARDVVAEYDRQSGLDGSVQMAGALAFGPEHPYAALHLRPSFSKVSLDSVRRRLRRFYNVAGARLSIVGDFDAKRLVPVVQKTFASLRGAAVPPLPLPAASPAQRTGELHAANIRPALIWSWRTPGYLTPDDIALDVTARYLGHRLSQRLGTGGKRAGSGARQASHTGQSLFWLHLPLDGDGTPAAAERAAREELDAIAAGQVDAGELELAKSAIIREIASGMDELSARARHLASYAINDGQLGGFAPHLGAYASIDAAKLSDVVRRQLGQPAGVLRVVPEPGAVARKLVGFAPATFSGPDAPGELLQKDGDDWYRPPTQVPTVRFDPPRVHEATIGAARLLFMPRQGLPTIRLRVAVNWRGPDPSRVARALLLNNLLQARPHSGAPLRERLIDLGARLETSFDEDCLELVVTSVVERADAVMVALRDTLELEHFDPATFDTVRADMIQAQDSQRLGARTAASYWFERVAYVDSHRYHRGPIEPTARLAAARAYTVKQLESFWKNERRIASVTIGIVGGIDEERARALAKLAAPRFGAAPPAKAGSARQAPATFLVDAPEVDEVWLRFSWPTAGWGTQGFVDGIGLRWVFARKAGGALDQSLAANGVKNARDWYSNTSSRRDDTSVVLSLHLPKDEVPGLFKSVKEHVARLKRAEIPWDQEQEARREAVQWLAQMFEGSEGYLRLLAGHADLEVPSQAVADMYLLAQRMNRASLAKAADALSPEKATVVAYGPVAELKASLQDSGFAPLAVVKAHDEGKAR